MTDSAKHLPNATSTPGGSTAWTTSSGTIPNAWQLIDNGVATPVDTQFIYCLGGNVVIDVKFDWTGLPEFTTTVRKIVLSFRYLGQQVTLYPDVEFKFYTDYPTPLARLIHTDTADFYTNGATQNKSWVFTDVADNIACSRDELINLRMRYTSLAGVGGGGKLPQIYQEP